MRPNVGPWFSKEGLMFNLFGGPSEIGRLVICTQRHLGRDLGNFVQGPRCPDWIEKPPKGCWYSRIMSYHARLHPESLPAFKICWLIRPMSSSDLPFSEQGAAATHHPLSWRPWRPWRPWPHGSYKALPWAFPVGRRTPPLLGSSTRGPRVARAEVATKTWGRWPKWSISWCKAGQTAEEPARKANYICIYIYLYLYLLFIYLIVYLFIYLFMSLSLFMHLLIYTCIEMWASNDIYRIPIHQSKRHMTAPTPRTILLFQSRYP